MSLDPILSARLQALEADGLRRILRRIEHVDGVHIRHQGRELLNFASNDYLGLAGHPALAEAAAAAARDWGAGSAASRLISGSLAPHHLLEEALADWLNTGAALAFSSGYAAAIGTIPALVGPEDIVIIDKLTHACCIDAARLSGAQLRVFKHNDLDDLSDILRWADSIQAVQRPNILVVTESIFSMDGHVAPLRELVDLKDRHGAWLMLDEAHATGLFGPRRAGLAHDLGLADRIDIHLGTLGKAVGSAGGFIAGSRTLIDFLIHRARTFLFSTAPVPAAAAAAHAGLDLIRSNAGADRANATWSRANQLASILPGTAAPTSAILPWIIGSETRALATAGLLLDAGFFAPAIRFPTVPRSKARLRFTVSAAHTEEHISRLAAALPQLAA